MVHYTTHSGNHVNLDALVLGIGLEHTQYIGADSLAHQHAVALLGIGDCHHHGLGSGSCAVIHRGVAYLHTGQLGHHALVLKDVLQGAL